MRIYSQEKMPLWNSFFTPRNSRSIQNYYPARNTVEGGRLDTSQRTGEELEHSYSEELEAQRKCNRELRIRLTACKHELLRVQEQIRRKDELCAQLEAEATAAENLHHEQLTSLCGKINALENDLQIVNEEDCVREWRKLRMSLDRWVKRNFQNTAKLDQLDYSAILRSMGTAAAENIATRNNHQRWAILQTWIMGMLHRHIFLNPCPGLNSNKIELFHELDRLIFEQCGVNTWKHCKSGINTALSTFVKPSRATLIEQLVTDVERKLGKYTSTVQGNRQQQLHSIFSQCADFKVMCSQQPQIFKFISSPSGCTVDRTCMANAAGIIDCSEMTVAFSLWPSLWKGERLGNSYCLEPELIWALAV